MKEREAHLKSTRNILCFIVFRINPRDDEMFKSLFLSTSVKDLLFTSTLDEQSEDSNGILLTDSVSSSDSLHILERVEVLIEDDNDICRSESQTDSSCSSTQDEDRVRRIGIVEAVDVCVPRTIAT